MQNLHCPLLRQTESKVATGFNDQIICMPFFGEYDYETVQNGPIWIMGTPLFYEYEVHYVGASALDTGVLTGGASLLSMEG